MLEFINPKYRDLQAVAEARKDAYASGDPYPHTYFTEFFNPDLLDEIIAEFPDLEKKGDIKFNNPNEVKLASRGEGKFGPTTRRFMHFLNSEPFLDFLQELTGIEETLMPDPYFEGGGMHQSKRGGFLKIHADFNKHRRTGLDRRLNVLVYLNRDWDEDWGGAFELWNRDMTKCVKKVPCHFNTLCMFTTDDYSYHGLPDPITCPPEYSRRSLALYYYTNGRPDHEINHGLEDHNTLFRERAGADDQMRGFNRKQRVKDVVKDFVPPILMKMVGKN